MKKPEIKEPEHYCRENHLKDNEGNIMATGIVPCYNPQAIWYNKGLSKMEAYYQPKIKLLREALEETIKRPKGVVPDIAVKALKETETEGVG